MNLRPKLLLILLGALFSGFLLAYGIVALYTENEVRSYVYSEDTEEAEHYARLLTAYWADHGSWSGIDTFLANLPVVTFKLAENSVRYELVPSSIAPPDSRVEITLMRDRIALADDRGRIVADTVGKLVGTVQPGKYLANGIPILAGSLQVGTILVGSMVGSSAEGFLKSVMNAFLAAFLSATLVAFIIVLAFMNRTTAPLRFLAQAAESISRGEISRKIVATGRDEVARLAFSFNGMAESLRMLEDARKRIIADSAHELRTPVTLIRGTVEAMLDGVYPFDRQTLESLHEETVRLSKLIEMLRELELIDSGKLALNTCAVDLEELARKDLLLFQQTLRKKGIRFSLDAGQGLPRLIADPLRLQEVVFNLLANAVDHTPFGGKIALSLTADTRTAIIVVEDSGPGIPESEREKIFERFYRIDPTRSAQNGGSGLGLSISREIVRAHAGEIRVLDSLLGGARFEVRLPLQGMGFADSYGAARPLSK
jgi:signal transduction histidine kinase